MSGDSILKTATLHSSEARQGAYAGKFPPLELENRPTVPTEQAAYYLHRQPQTLRGWAMKDGSGPIRARRIHGRLAWSVAEIRALLGVAA